MKLSSVLFSALGLFGAVEARAAKPPYFILTGDSTVAVNGGWGNGFLSYVKDPAAGINSAKGGATIPSFRSQGLWDKAIANVKSHLEDYEPILTMQFGHNDQKTYTVEQFKENFAAFVKEAKEAGATPIILTSLTRRVFQDGHVIENLKEFSEAAISVAKAGGIQYLDLNLASTNYVNAIGEENAHKYNLASGDNTHLNPSGEIVFGRMVADLLLEKRRDLQPYIASQEALSEKIKKGEYATGDE
ncbi:hypothetical protein FDECE_14119 [Fusarium decemcellulare]|nr:hypothetical protein FDECE_14119 [Fusarium decemcellulare]